MLLKNGLICWYFTDSWEQFRISGRVDVIDGSNPDTFKLQQREKSWFSSSVKSRLQYLGPNPSLPRISEHQSEEEVRLDPSIGPVAAFCLLVLDPDQRESIVDFVSVSKAMRWTHNGIPGMYMVDVE
ncbi:hypothetical protein J1N35_019099 [Gossypium stocksii]|uniref:pyridoxal 5'-phosphate synthase n=1 Tax=Gossypium stocksii TaxID=47602 RepID=A0A9D3VRK4_9ROSI|nr:hypothetical protein J1N35_019099 [Gossypium stocksii]